MCPQPSASTFTRSTCLHALKIKDAGASGPCHCEAGLLTQRIAARAARKQGGQVPAAAHQATVTMLQNDIWNCCTPAEAIKEETSPWKQFRVTLMPTLWFDCLAGWKLAVVLRSLHGARRQRCLAHLGFLNPQRMSQTCTRCQCISGHILQTFTVATNDKLALHTVVGPHLPLDNVRARWRLQQPSKLYTPDDLMTADHELSCRFVMLSAKPSTTTLHLNFADRRSV